MNTNPNPDPNSMEPLLFHIKASVLVPAVSWTQPQTSYSYSRPVWSGLWTTLNQKRAMSLESADLLQIPAVLVFDNPLDPLVGVEPVEGHHVTEAFGRRLRGRWQNSPLNENTPGPPEWRCHL